MRVDDNVGRPGRTRGIRRVVSWVRRTMGEMMIDPKEKLWSGKGLMIRVFRIRLSSAENFKIKHVI
jgi:hypothetical protein